MDDRLFWIGIRRTLLKLVSMIEDRYGLKPVNTGRREARASKNLR